MRHNSKGKRFLAFLLAAVLMLSVCPLAASAEDSTEATQPPETTVAAESTETVVTPEPTETIVTSEPTETTIATDPVETTAATEQPDTTVTNEPTEPTETSAATEPTETTAVTEPEEVSEAVKAFLEAVKAIVLPEELNEETGSVLSEQIGAATEAYDALSEEELAREDVQAAAVEMKKAMDFLTGPRQTLETTCVAKIGDEEYETLDAAVAAATDGATIELLADATTEGLELNKDLTIQAAEEAGKPTITFTKYGIALWGKALTFKNVNAVMTGIGSTPYTGEWNWMTICASPNASLSLNNATLTMDGTGAGNAHAIYFCSNNKLNLTNGSVLTIKNYSQDALEWDGGDGGYNVNITDSTFISNHNRSGFTGTFYATISNSKVDVINSTGNGSNGSHFNITNKSVVNFNDNKDHGLSAGNLLIDNSTVTTNGNGANGISTTGTMTIQNSSTVTVENNACSISSKWTIPGAVSVGLGDSVIKGSKVTIQNNKGTGIYQKAATGSLTIEDSADVTIVKNTAEKLGLGGGIYVNGTVTLANNVVLYNNHAGTAGDDIYNVGTITFGKVGSDWALDGAPDCTDDIDGWYYDGYATDKDGIVISSRWDAHSGNPYTVEYTDYGKAFTGKLALKAAHTLNVDVPDLPVVTPDWKVSKSKTATNLDKNFESKVTLSLPSAEQQLVSDVVFVLDKSTSADLENQALQMLKDLQTQIQNTSAKVNVGVVIFNKEAHVTNFMDLATQYSAIEAAIKQEISSGTNTHAGLLAGKAMLDADTSVSASRKYLIFVSDGITYMYNAVPTVTAWTFKADTVLNWAGPDNWNSKYKSNDAPESWKDYLVAVSKQVAAQGTLYEYPYGGTVTNATPVEKQSDYANSIDKALYLTYLAYQSIAQEGYHCYAVKADTGSGGQYEWGPSFMEFLAGGSTYSFETIKNDILYLVDKGSRVEDFIGYVEGDYDFDFVNDADSMELKIGDATYKAVKLGENEYGFKKAGEGYAYTVTYVKGDGKGEEHFVWYINEPITNFAPVQLTYTVKLTNPKTAPGIYGVYDRDGSNATATALYTNNSATLYPVDSNGQKGEAQDFPKPTVSYEVKKTDPEPSKPTEPDPTIPDPTDPEPEWGKLTIDKSANRTTVRPGKTITYTIKVTNKTGVDLEDITVSEKLDGNLTFVSASGDGSYSVKDGLWTVSELKNGKTAKLTIKATVKSGVKDGTVIKNTVVITDVPDTPSDTVKVTVSNKISLIPQTGDTSSIGLWIGVMVACAVVLGVVLIFTVKKKKTR